MFVMGLMFWRLTSATQAEVSAQCARLADMMVERMHAELEAYYDNEMPRICRVQRVSELMNMVSVAEVG